MVINLIESKSKTGLDNFSILVDSYYDTVFYHCLKLAKNEYDAADITQNTFVKAFINFDKVNNTDSVGAWIFTICNNKAKLFFRNNSRKFEQSCKIDTNQSYNNLYTALSSLKEEHRKLILLKYFSSFTEDEIVLLTGLKKTVVKSRLYEARKILRDLLSKKDVTNLTAGKKNRRYIVMEMIKLMDLGSRVLPCMSLHAQKELMLCAKERKKFTDEVISELSKISEGDEFVLECSGKLSYEEFLRILGCCNDDILYRLNGQDFKTWRRAKPNGVLKDFRELNGSTGFVDSIEMIVYVPSLKDTVEWYKKHLGWEGSCNEEDEEYCHTVIYAHSVEIGSFMNNSLKGFHLRRTNDVNMISKGDCFVMVSGIEEIYNKVKESGWESYSEIYESGWGTKQFTVTDLNGFTLEFSEWIC